MYQDDTATISAKIETHVSRLGPQFPSVQSLIAPAVCKIVRYRTRLGAACTTVSDPLVRQLFIYHLPHAFTVLCAIPCSTKEMDADTGSDVPTPGNWPVDPQEDVPVSKDRIWVDGCFDFAHHGTHTLLSGCCMFVKS